MRGPLFIGEGQTGGTMPETWEGRVKDAVATYYSRQYGLVCARTRLAMILTVVIAVAAAIIGGVLVRFYWRFESQAIAFWGMIVFLLGVVVWAAFCARRIQTQEKARLDCVEIRTGEVLEGGGRLLHCDRATLQEVLDAVERGDQRRLARVAEEAMGVPDLHALRFIRDINEDQRMIF